MPRITDDDDKWAAGPGVWESVEVMPVASTTATRRPRAALAGALLVLAAVVAVGLWPSGSPGPAADAVAEQCPDTDVTPAAAGARPSIDRGLKTDVRLPASPAEKKPTITVLVPTSGEVILGPWVAVAGRVDLARREPAEVIGPWIHVEIEIGGELVGETDLRVAGHGFAGSIPIVEQAQGRVAKIRISDIRRVDHVLVEQEVVLGPSR